MNHAAASTPNVVTEGLLLDHGETETRPMPAPSATNAKENAAATNAPAKTAAQDTPETVSVSGSTAVAVDKGTRPATVACVISLISAHETKSRTRLSVAVVSNFRHVLLNSVVEKRDQDDDRDRNSE
jgi:hypothetical protein